VFSFVLLDFVVIVFFYIFVFSFILLDFVPLDCVVSFVLIGCAFLPRWCLHLNVVGKFASFCDPESYAGGSVATGMVTQAGQVKE
jgi:hypothetical protein